MGKIDSHQLIFRTITNLLHSKPAAISGSSSRTAQWRVHFGSPAAVLQKFGSAIQRYTAIRLFCPLLNYSPTFCACHLRLQTKCHFQMLILNHEPSRTGRHRTIWFRLLNELCLNHPLTNIGFGRIKYLLSLIPVGDAAYRLFLFTEHQK